MTDIEKDARALADFHRAVHRKADLSPAAATPFWDRQY